MENFIGEIRMFPYGNLPRGWYYCDGRILNTDGEAKNLFGYIQFTYGGNGTTTFALPDLRGTLALCANNIDPNRPMRQLGLAGGSLTNQLVEANLPAHTHAVNTYTGGTGNSSIVAGKCLAYLSLADEDSQYADGGAGKMVKMDPKMLLSTRVATSYSIEQPVLGLMFAIAYQGIYPTRP